MSKVCLKCLKNMTVIDESETCTIYYCTECDTETSIFNENHNTYNYLNKGTKLWYVTDTSYAYCILESIHTKKGYVTLYNINEKKYFNVLISDNAIYLSPNEVIDRLHKNIQIFKNTFLKTV